MTNETGARLGILMLDTRFPRILGDVGHAGSWDFPVRYAVCRGPRLKRSCATISSPSCRLLSLWGAT